ncbi:hypothetical protein DRF75_01160 [Ehrlichia minasensis]|uniref:Uncharacterized protein n=1 Tax=Ehrlichia minasensis TaxID=1242993 RepID=A0A4Q6I8M0_9RICK|nr:hypothetical protein [Ehrlichia minasensis]RZB13076.1 hypothetical protein DRF75_01160 [Ehrlichia minasensis]
MQLIFLFKDDIPTLVPKNVCKYNKALDRYESEEPNLNLTVPLGLDNPDSQFRHLYNTVFDRYCIATSVSFDYDILFLFGRNRSGVNQYIVCCITSSDLRNIIKYGLVLQPGTLISAGGMMVERPIEEHSLALFEMFCDKIKIAGNRESTRSFRIDFFNDKGECFDYKCKNAALSEISVDTAGNDVYIMSLT